MWTRIGLRPTSTVTRHPTDAPFITRLAQSTLNQYRLSYTPSHHLHTHSVCLHAHSSCTGAHPLASSVSTSTSTSTSGSSVRSPPILAPGQMPPADHPNLPGWYQRPLPQYLIPFSSNRGKQIFKEAMNNGGMEGYFALAEQFQTQSTPSYCGPGTLAMVLNALALDPKRLWKGNWRWFSEEMLETCDIRKPSSEPLAGVDVHGLSFEEFLFLAECNGAHVRALRDTESSLGKFRAAIATATTRTDLHVVASFSRKVLGQTGSGHYSPIGGYHAGLDLALVLDVARFKYPPYWAPVELLWKAICNIDEATGRGRGYYLMSKGKLSVQVPAAAADATIFTPLSSACRIAVDKDSWSRLAEHFCSVLPLQLQKQYDAGHFRPENNNTAATTFAPSSSHSSASTTAPLPSRLDLEVSAIFREILLSLPVELSSIFMMYTHDLNERMIAQYQKQERERKLNNSADEASSSPDKCNSSSSCQVHASALSIYHTLLPKHTPHIHSHTVAPVHALQPLLQSIASTRIFQLLSLATIDFSSLSSQNNPSHLLAGSLEGELELAALLLFACPEQIFSHLPSDVQRHISDARNSSELLPPLQVEVRNLRAQMGILAEFCLCGAVPSVKGNDNPNVDHDQQQEANQAAQIEGFKHIAEELHSAHGYEPKSTNSTHSAASRHSSASHTRASTMNTAHHHHHHHHHHPHPGRSSMVSHRFISVARSKTPAKTN